MAEWHLYMIRCAKGTLYTGITTDVARRFREHSAGRGARYLRGRGPLELVYQHPVQGRNEALKLEIRVKKLSRQRKEALIMGACSMDELLNTIIIMG
ncbi:GIY-YIG nuclease family protein [Kistimonas scapharcae]|uniref:GIY-YIG nuclease family protein n=1 Tax=Kistimonas scapharcae TaxID=1036133 RepID=A0ABP8V170_9GAMM